MSLIAAAKKMGWMKITVWLLSLLLIGITLYQSRSIFSYRYEPEYYENLYYHSQWNIPGSTRGISDGELYKFVGYRLAQGENPFNINFEVPPFAKYLYGLAEMYLGNPYLVSIILYLVSIFVLWKLVRILFKNPALPRVAVLLFVSTPFVATQVRETMLDLPLMAAFILHLWMMVKYLKDKSSSSLIGAGVFLGIFTGIKIGVYTPLVLLLGMVVIWLTRKKVVDFIKYLVAVGGGYVFAFFCYFVKHPNPLPWLRLHEKPIGFYRDSMGVVDHWNQWRSIFLNTYQGWWQPGKAMSMGDWSWLLPVGVVLTVWVLIRSIRQRDWLWFYISGVIASVLMINTMIPFWPRYLMPIVPIFILTIGKALGGKKMAVVVLVLLAITNIPFLHSSLNSDKIGGNVEATVRFIGTRANRELYRGMTREQRQQIPEDFFVDSLEDFWGSLGTRKIEAEIVDVNQSANKATALIKLTYITDYGPISRETNFEYKRINNQWKLNWKWDYLWDGYKPEVKIEIAQGDIPLARIVDRRGNLIAERGVEKVLYVIPRLMFDWTKQLDQFAKIVGINSMQVDRIIKQNVPDKYPRFVGYVNHRLTAKELDYLAKTTGAVIKDVKGIEIVESYRNDDNILKQIDDLRLDRPELFYIPANIEIVDGDKRIMVLKTNQSKNINTTITF